MHHGYKNLDRAIDVMNHNDKEDFRDYVNTQTSYSANNMFIAKKEVADQWFKNVFEWLFECEKIIGFKNLKGYETRMYAYLAERYLSFWFNKYTNPIEWPWVFADLDKFEQSMIELKIKSIINQINLDGGIAQLVRARDS